jgi:hypothetical protein
VGANQCIAFAIVRQVPNKQWAMGHIPNSVTPRTFEDRAESPRTRSAVLFMSQATSLAPQDAGPRLFEHGTVLFQGSNYHVRQACEQASGVVRECMYAISLSTLIRGSTLYVCRGGNKDMDSIHGTDLRDH